MQLTRDLFAIAKLLLTMLSPLSNDYFYFSLLFSNEFGKIILDLKSGKVCLLTETLPGPLTGILLSAVSKPIAFHTVCPLSDCR